MGQLPQAMPRAISEAGQVRCSALPPGTRRQICDLLQALAAVEGHFAAGGPAKVPAMLLRDLVVIIVRLVGRTWLDAHVDTTAAALCALPDARQLPPLAELDQILASVLSNRFRQAPAAATGGGVRPLTQLPPGAARQLRISRFG